MALLLGPESLLADRAVERIRRALREQMPDLEVVAVAAPLYESGQLATWTSPSLFGEPRLLVADDVDAASDAFFADAAAYLGDLADDVVLVVRHGGGQRGKKLLDAIRACPQAVVVDCQPVKKDAEKQDFVAAEFSGAGRRASPHAVRALLEAVGGDLRELAAACAQLMADVVGPDGRPVPIDVEHVDRYYGGRAEVTGFRVADAAVAGQRELALGLLRHAIDSGVDPVPLVAAVAMKLRTMVKVAAAGRGRSADVARQLGLAPWQVDRARRELQGWTPDGLAAGLLALAEADTAVKGGGRDPVYAVEKALVTITAARS